MIVGARLLKPETSGTAELSLALTRLVSTDAGSRGRSGGNRPSAGLGDGAGAGPELISAKNPAAGSAAGSASDTAEAATGILLLSGSSSVYLGQPYVVAPDGRIFQPWASEAGYSILVHSFARFEEVQP